MAVKFFWKKKNKEMMKTSKGLTEFTLQKYGNMERAARGKDTTGRYLTCQGKKIKTLPLRFRLRKMVEKNTGKRRATW